jgi:hypothetical protein
MKKRRITDRRRYPIWKAVLAYIVMLFVLIILAASLPL